MPKVTLISYTGHGHPDPLYAARLLAFTKATRLQMTPSGFNSFAAMPEDALNSELSYMAGTIPSSWEFLDLIFSIEKVSRATAQQITRTRNASYAMQSQRVNDMSEVTWDAPESMKGETSREDWWNDTMSHQVQNYSDSITHGDLPLEEARDLLPIGVHCNLLAKYNLRALVELVRSRDSIRVQKPYRDIGRMMKEETLCVWPWASVFFEHPMDKAMKMIEEVASELADAGAVYKGPSGKLAKAIDLIKKA